MALARRSSQRFNNAIWPGFVDAMTGLLLVLMFVLTIFMVIQFVLRETITGQESELNELAAEVASLTQILGLERDRTAALENDLTDAQTEAAAQTALISRLTLDLENSQTALVDAQNQITGFEAQVAGLLAERVAQDDVIAGLETEQSRLLSEQEALNLALAQARDEIDAGVEAARLAAAQEEALQALIADLRAQGEDDATRITALEQDRLSNVERISELEAAELAQAAAAEALRERLANADTELTAMTLALEEKRREAEETLTLLAATEAARDDLTENLAAALLAQQTAETSLAAAAETEQSLNAQLLAALAAQGSSVEAIATLEERLNDRLKEIASLQTQLDQTTEVLTTGNIANDDLSARLAAALLANEQLSRSTDEEIADLRERLEQAVQAEVATAEDAALALQELQAQLAAALLAQQTSSEDAAAREQELQNQLVEALLAQQQAEAAVDNTTQTQQDLQDRLAEALLARESLEAQVAVLSDTSDEAATLRSQLAAALAEQSEAQSAADQQAALLARANEALSEEEALSAESQRQVALLNAQVAELRSQVGSLQELLNVAAEADSDAQVQIDRLGEQLNTALARVAAEERRRAALEEAERIRLESEAARLAAESERLASEAQDLERFRSDFFGELRAILEGQEGVQIVGDRFVFSSEVLFQSARAELSPLGQQEIAKVAAILRDVADDIPAGIDWVIRVDGHTDNTPLSGFGQYADNWELSQARALSVVRFMTNELGIPPTRLAANGFGEFQPINTADTDEARAQNRRIELKLTEK